MKIDVSGGFSVSIKRRRKKHPDQSDLEAETEVFRPGFQPNPDEDEEEDDGD